MKKSSSRLSVLAASLALLAPVPIKASSPEKGLKELAEIANAINVSAQRGLRVAEEEWEDGIACSSLSLEDGSPLGIECSGDGRMLRLEDWRGIMGNIQLTRTDAEGNVISCRSFPESGKGASSTEFQPIEGEGVVSPGMSTECKEAIEEGRYSFRRALKTLLLKGRSDL